LKRLKVNLLKQIAFPSLTFSLNQRMNPPLACGEKGASKISKVVNS
jgi:hypothetical protein